MTNIEDIHACGLILQEHEACKLLGEAYNKSCKSEEDYYDEFDMSLYTLREWLNDFGIDVTVIDSDFEGSFYEVNQTKHKPYDDESCIALIICADKSPKLVGTAYHSLEELVTEMKDKMSKFLPDNFDYVGHLGEYEGIVSYF